MKIVDYTGSATRNFADPAFDGDPALATQEEIDTITKYAFAVNEQLKKIMADVNIKLVDFKLEFGRLADGTIILADEISPDTCRFWDATTGAHLDKDLFRRGLGGEEAAYQEVMSRLLG